MLFGRPNTWTPRELSLCNTREQVGRPSWAEITVEPQCPQCGYNLRMLLNPRCPECGQSFVWEEVIAVAKYGVAISLFEHKWRTRPVGSLLATLCLTLQPWKLWSRTPLRPDARIKPLLVLVALACLVYAALAFVRIHTWYWILQSSGTLSVAIPFWSYWHTREVLLELGLPSLFSILVLLVIQLCRQTIARYQITQRHILRIVILTWVGIVMLRSLVEIACALVYGVLRGSTGRDISYPDYLMGVVGLMFLLLSFGMAFSVYLKIRGGWPWAFVLVGSAAILALTFLEAAGGAFYHTVGNPMAYMLHVWTNEWWVNVYQ